MEPSPSTLRSAPICLWTTAAGQKKSHLLALTKEIVSSMGTEGLGSSTDDTGIFQAVTADELQMKLQFRPESHWSSLWADSTGVKSFKRNQSKYFTWHESVCRVYILLLLQYLRALTSAHTLTDPEGLAFSNVVPRKKRCTHAFK